MSLCMVALLLCLTQPYGHAALDVRTRKVKLHRLAVCVQVGYMTANPLGHLFHAINKAAALIDRLGELWLLPQNSDSA